MKIPSINSYNNGFGSKKLFQAKINKEYKRSKQISPVNAFITEIGVSDIPKFGSEEYNRLYQDLGESIIDWMYKNQKEKKKSETLTFYAIEVPDRKKVNRIRSMAMITELKRKKIIHIDFIQKFDTPDGERAVKGGGSCLLYAILKKAKAVNAEAITLYSLEEAMDFYRKFDFLFKKSSNLELRASKFAHLLRLLQKKYSIKRI